MTWHTGTLEAIGLITTGPDPETARIASACVMRVDASGRDKPIAQQWPDEAPPEEVISEATAALVRAVHGDRPIVVFDAARALTVLDRECRRHGLPTLGELARDGQAAPVICAHVLDGYASGRPGEPSLTDACARWDVRLKDPADPAWRAWTAAGIAVRIAQRHQAIAAMDLPRLHAAQQEWHRQQCLSHAAYLRRKAAFHTETRSVEAQLELHERAKSLDAVAAGDWPVPPPTEQQEALT
jgi:DNA polymerase-3 subunit epsilon